MILSKQDKKEIKAAINAAVVSQATRLSVEDKDDMRVIIAESANYLDRLIEKSDKRFHDLITI